MLISKTVEVTWNSKIKLHYVNAGYVFTKMGDSFTVNVDDLTTGSGVIVTAKCDYCGCIYDIPYYKYLSGHNNSEIKKDCCNKCKKEKIKGALMARYGVSTPDKVDGAREKIKETNLKIYGVENPFASEIVKEKIINTNLKRYGVEYASQCEKVQEVRKQTCIERYGVDSHMKTEKYRKMFAGENSPNWKPDKDRISRERDRSCIEYRQWRTNVFQRDHYKCQHCGGRGDRKFGVEAHHIVNYSTNEKLRFDVNNGVTLCHQCHKMFHSTYGKKNNNLSQLTLFLNQGKKIC